MGATLWAPGSRYGEVMAVSMVAFESMSVGDLPLKFLMRVLWPMRCLDERELLSDSGDCWIF